MQSRMELSERKTWGPAGTSGYQQGGHINMQTAAGTVKRHPKTLGSPRKVLVALSHSERSALSTWPEWPLETNATENSSVEQIPCRHREGKLMCATWEKENLLSPKFIKEQGELENSFLSIITISNISVLYITCLQTSQNEAPLIPNLKSRIDRVKMFLITRKET